MCCILTGSGETSDYDYTVGLLRVLPQGSRRPRNLLPLVRRVIAERSQLPPADIVIREYSKVPAGDPDQYSNSILGKYCDSVGGLCALSVSSDGNCLFHAASLQLSGSEQLSSELRLRTLIEMVTNKDHYLNKYRDNNFMSCDGDYDAAILDCADNYEHSSIWTMCALATVIERNIISVYPAVNRQGCSDDVNVNALNVILEASESLRKDFRSIC